MGDTTKDGEALRQLAEVKGQLTAMTTMLTQQHASTQSMLRQQHESTNQRIDDLRASMDAKHAATDKRVDGAVGRIGTLEANERATAIKAATIGVFTSGVVSAVIAALKIKGGG